MDYGIIPYQRVVKFNWAQIQLGHRYTFSKKGKHNFFLENGIMADLICNDKSNYLKKTGFSYRLRVGFQYEIMDGIKVIFNSFYKTAVTKYNQRTIGINNNYFPYNYGIEIGASSIF
ncbi:MAG: hypothetical protein AB8F94_04560 [Saprospiraceae bacterium]